MECSKLQDPSASILEFISFSKDVRQPICADRSAGGTIPVRAYRYCEPLTSASALGYYVFPPMSFSLLNDGSNNFWRFEDSDDWNRLDYLKLQSCIKDFDDIAPEGIRGYSPDFLASTAGDPNLIQIWSGLIVRTRPGWSTLVRSPVNFPAIHNYKLYDGLVETDSWFGPLFTNIKIIKTDTPIHFDKNMPFLQVLPIERASLRRAELNRTPIMADFRTLDSLDWENLSNALGQFEDSSRRKGHYATAVRKRWNKDAALEANSALDTTK